MTDEPRGIGGSTWTDPEKIPSRDPVPVGTPGGATPSLPGDVPARIRGGEGIDVISEGLGYQIRLGVQNLEVAPASGALWTPVWHDSDGRYYRVDFSTISAQIAALDENLDDRIEAVEGRVRDQLLEEQADYEEATSARMTMHEQLLDARLDGYETTITARIDQWEISTDERMDAAEASLATYQGAITQRVTDFETATDQRMDAAEGSIADYQGTITARVEGFETSVNQAIVAVDARMTAFDLLITGRQDAYEAGINARVTAAEELAQEAMDLVVSGSVADGAVTLVKLGTDTRALIDSKLDEIYPQAFGQLGLEQLGGQTGFIAKVRGDGAEDQITFTMVTKSDTPEDYLGLPQSRGWMMVGRGNAHPWAPNAFSWSYWDGTDWQEAMTFRAADRVAEFGARPEFAGQTPWDSGNLTVTTFAKTLLDDANAAAVKTTLALQNVSNTSDANKPVSTAQAAADALRVLKAGDTMAGPLAFSDDGEGPVFSRGGKMYDTNTAGSANLGRTLVIANNNSFEVLTEDGTDYILQAHYSGTFQFNGNTVWTTANFNPANYQPAGSYQPAGNYLVSGTVINVNGIYSNGAASGSYGIRADAGGTNYGVDGRGGDAGVIGFASVAGGNWGKSGYGSYSFYGNAVGYVAGLLYSVGSMNSTTASAANVWQNASNGNYGRSTSSLRYKTDIETLWDSAADNLMKMRPVYYRSADNTIDNPEDSWYGLIAEELAAIDPRLVQWMELPMRDAATGEILIEPVKLPMLNEDGTPYIDPQGNPVTYDNPSAYAGLPIPSGDVAPEGVSYERLTVLMINMLQRQEERIAKLEELAKVVAPRKPKVRPPGSVPEVPVARVPRPGEQKLLHGTKKELL